MLLEGSNPHCFPAGVPNILERRKQKTSGEKEVCVSVCVKGGLEKIGQVYRDDK